MSATWTPPANPAFQIPVCPIHRNPQHSLTHVSVSYAKGHRLDGSTPDLEAHTWQCSASDAEWFIAGDRPATRYNRKPRSR